MDLENARDEFALAHQQVEAVICSARSTLREHIRVQAIRHAEKLQCLIDQVRAEIEKNTGTRFIAFAPSIRDRGSKAVPSRFEQIDLAELVFTHQALQRLKVAVPATVLKHPQHSLMLLSESREMP